MVNGSMLGPYRVLDKLGEGGMGEVYRARDTRLDRDVAIKVLPEDVARDEIRLRRFEQEARAASALNHPNILSIFDVGATSGVHYLVTELVEGTTLRDRLGHGGLPPREVVHIGAQIADGLAAAHGAGLVHRDLKPENVMTTRDGRVKILDFGLAKLIADMGAADATRTALSHPGLIVGTIGYLSPEQVQAGAVDARSDLFSLGVVLHELTTGARAFQRQTTVETLSAILKEDPADLPATVPIGLGRIVAHCLEKDPARRFQTAQDVAFALRSFATTTTLQAIPAEMRPPRRTLWWIAAPVAALVLIATGLWLARTFTPPPADTPLVDLNSLRFVPFAVDETPEHSGAWSPDGRSVAYARSAPGGDTQIVLRAEDLSSISVLAREPTASRLFWAPDGSRVYYLASEAGTSDAAGWSLKSVGVLGGATRVDVPGAIAAHISPDGRLLAVWKPEDTGGRVEAALWIGPVNGPLARYEPAPVVVPGAIHPTIIAFSPDGRRMLLWATGGSADLLSVPVPATGLTGGPAERLFAGQIDGHVFAIAWMPDSQRVILSINDSLWLGDLAGDRLTRLTADMVRVMGASVAPDGRVIFTDDRSDRDVVSLSLAGGPPRVVVGTSLDESAAAWAPRGGRVTYVSSRAGEDEIWTRAGEELSDRRLLTPDEMPDPGYRNFRSLAFSPDGQWLAFTGFGGGTREPRVWIMPAGGGTPRSVTPEGVLAQYPSWAPDGRALVVLMLEDGRPALWIVGLDGAQAPRRLPMPDGVVAAMAEWSPTGGWIAAIDWRGGPGPTLLIHPDTGEARSLPTLGSPALVWSADGRTLYGVDTRQGTAKLRARRGDRRRPHRRGLRRAAATG